MKLTPCGWAFLRAEPQVGVRKKQTIKHTPNMLRIAIQAKGRLNEQSIDLLSEAGIRVAESKRKLISRAEGFPLEVLYLRDDDIPQAVSMGVADLGIVGLNEVAEKGFPVEQIMDLGFGGCRWPYPKRPPTKASRSSAAGASPPPTPTSSPATSPRRGSRPRSTPSKAPWRSPRR